jgi:hypothetical protein
MHAVVGPVLTREGCYAFDLWTREEGLSRGYAYRRIGDAHYARNAEIRSRRRERPDTTVVCSTLDEFTLAVAEREATFRALVSNLDAKSVEPAHPPEQHCRAPIGSEAKVGHSAVWQPSRARRAPVVKPASSGSRKTTPLAISLAAPGRRWQRNDRRPFSVRAP